MIKLLLESSEYLVVQLDGILSYPTAERVEQELMGLLNTHRKSKLLINMEQVRFMDSAGLFPLVHSLKLAKRLGKTLTLCGIPPCVQLILQITGLEQTFHLSNSPLPDGNASVYTANG